MTDVVESGVLGELIGLARRQRVALLEYLKPGEHDSTERHVEPYRLQESAGENLMVQCWQIKPSTGDRCKWRNFRIDRIVGVRDAGVGFKPRCPVTLADGEVTDFKWGHEPAQSLGAGAAYFKFIETAMLDGKITGDELYRAREMARGIPVDELRGLHAQVFRNVLDEVLQDTAVSDREVRYLSGVRQFLSALGWAP